MLIRKYFLVFDIYKNAIYTTVVLYIQTTLIVDVNYLPK